MFIRYEVLILVFILIDDDLIGIPFILNTNGLLTSKRRCNRLERKIRLRRLTALFRNIVDLVIYISVNYCCYFPRRGKRHCKLD